MVWQGLVTAEVIAKSAHPHALFLVTNNFRTACSNADPSRPHRWQCDARSPHLWAYCACHRRIWRLAEEPAVQVVLSQVSVSAINDRSIQAHRRVVMAVRVPNLSSKVPERHTLYEAAL